MEKLLNKGMPADAHPAKWAYRVCKNVWIDEIRAREVRQRHAGSVADEQEDAVSAEDAAGIYNIGILITKANKSSIKVLSAL